MLGIPFLKTPARSKSRLDELKIKPVLSELVPRAMDLLRDNQPEKAFSLIAPRHLDDDAPDELRLVAGHALAALGRYPEALGHYTYYLARHPDSVIGLLAAGLAAARARQLAQASDWFRRASETATGRVKELLEPLLDADVHDPVTIGEMIADLESFPGDRERAIALACALGCAGHFRAVERFLPIFD